MPFDRLPHVSPAAHRHFERAFHYVQEACGLYWENTRELHIDAHFDPEWAATQEYRDLLDASVWRASYLDAFAHGYRCSLGAWHEPRHHRTPMAVSVAAGEDIPF